MPGQHPFTYKLTDGHRVTVGTVLGLREEGDWTLHGNWMYRQATRNMELSNVEFTHFHAHKSMGRLESGAPQAEA